MHYLRFSAYVLLLVCHHGAALRAHAIAAYGAAHQTYRGGAPVRFSIVAITLFMVYVVASSVDATHQVRSCVLSSWAA